MRKIFVTISGLLLGMWPTTATVLGKELKIVSWNIANLASGPEYALRGQKRSQQDYGDIRTILGGLDADIIALQEMGSLPSARRILSPDYEIVFETRCLKNAVKCTRDNDDIYTAIAYHKRLAARVTVFQLEQLALTHVDECQVARKVRGGVGVKITHEGTTFWIPSLHLKAACKDDRIVPDTEDDCKTQLEQFRRLGLWLDSLPEGDVAILTGDLNRKIHQRKDTMRKILFADRGIKPVFLPQQNARLCWSKEDYKFDWKKLQADTRALNPEFVARGIVPWIYSPRGNRGIDHFVITNMPKKLRAAADQLGLSGYYRFEAGPNTIKTCDGKIRITRPERNTALAFGRAYPSDRCPIILQISRR